MRNFDPISLRLFIAVCEERNIANAAKREAIVPSAVSKRISQMEDEAGVQLLERGRRGVMVTAAGEVLCRYARESLQLLDRMQAELGAFANGVQGHVRVFASKSAVAQVLPEDISLFAKRYRDVRVSLEEREIWKSCAVSRKGAPISACAGMRSTYAASRRFPTTAIILRWWFIPTIRLRSVIQFPSKTRSTSNMST